MRSCNVASAGSSRVRRMVRQAVHSSFPAAWEHRSGGVLNTAFRAFGYARS